MQVDGQRVSKNRRTCGRIAASRLFAQKFCLWWNTVVCAPGYTDSSLLFRKAGKGKSEIFLLYFLPRSPGFIAGTCGFDILIGSLKGKREKPDLAGRDAAFRKNNRT